MYTCWHILFVYERYICSLNLNFLVLGFDFKHVRTDCMYQNNWYPADFNPFSFQTAAKVGSVLGWTTFYKTLSQGGCAPSKAGKNAFFKLNSHDLVHPFCHFFFFSLILWITLFDLLIWSLPAALEPFVMVTQFILLQSLFSVWQV